jgi:hypothetical protein
MKKIFLIAPVCLLFFWAIAHASSDHVWISQIQVEGDGGANDEFVEIFNPTDTAVPLNSWSLQYKSGSGSTYTRKNLPSDAVVGPHDYYLIARSGYNGTVAADHTHSTFSLSAAATGATVFLVSSTTTLASGDESSIVDKVTYAGSTVPEAEQALIRNNADTDDDALDFTIGSANPHKSNYTAPVIDPPPSDDTDPETNPETDSGSTSNPPPPPPSSPSSGGGSSTVSYSNAVKISEFMVNPDGADSGEEWIEIYSTADVDLSDWKLDDEGKAGSVGSSAYVFPKGSKILANSYLVIDLSEDSFTLDNSGGDSVRLIWPDKKTADQVDYTASAEEEKSYARKPDNTFAWTEFVTRGAVNQFISSTPEKITSPAQMKIKINEIFPNPKGSDSGSEWIEVRNEGTEPVYLHNWTVDDGDEKSPIGSSAWKIQSPTVSPGGLALLMIPSGKFALDNTNKETVRLFNENGILVDSVSYEKSEEDKSYAFLDNKWIWTKPSPNAVNESKEETQIAKILINEIYPEPARGSKQEEFIELFNPTESTIDLDGFKLYDLSSSFKLNGKIESKKFFVIKKSESNISLNNTGQETVTLEDKDGKIIASVEYEDAPKTQSYNLGAEGTYYWSGSLTPGKENGIGKGDLGGSGEVLGLTKLPRTGNDKAAEGMDIAFVLWAIIWYIYVKLVKKEPYEQARID